MKKLDRQEIMLKRKIKTLQSRLFIDKMEADTELKSIREKFPNFKINGEIIAITRRIPKTKGRQKIGFKIKVRIEQNETKVARELERKGKFVLATSRVDYSQLNAEEIIAVYRNRNQGIEGCLKFLKNKDLRLNQIFLKKESRIEYEKVSIPLYSDPKR
ncbi:MAG: hypothetical protein P8Y45_18085 [Exilibacterium sp.]